MANLLRIKKTSLISVLGRVVSVQTKGAMHLVSRQIHDFLSIGLDGSNSGALLLTIHGLKRSRGKERLTEGASFCALPLDGHAFRPVHNL
jgi:hypothetical protein